MKLPHIQFYPGDWRKEVGIQSLSYYHRGIWFELLLLMHGSEERGKLVLNGRPMSNASLARLLGIAEGEAKDAIEALVASGVASRDQNGTILNRRMVREEELRVKRIEAGKVGGSKAQAKRQANPYQNTDNDIDIDSDSLSDSFGKHENLFFGSVPDDLRQLAPELLPTEKAEQWQDYVQSRVESLGYKVHREVGCDLGDEGYGRIDLVAYKDQAKIAIELDYRTPRQKSIRKVKLYPAGMVLLRDPKIVETTPEIARRKVRDFAKSEGIGEKDSDWFFFKCEGNGWTNNGKPIRDWKATIRTWWRAGYFPSQKQQAQKKPDPNRERLDREYHEARQKYG